MNFRISTKYKYYSLKQFLRCISTPNDLTQFFLRDTAGLFEFAGMAPDRHCRDPPTVNEIIHVQLPIIIKLILIENEKSTMPSRKFGS